MSDSLVFCIIIGVICIFTALSNIFNQITDNRKELMTFEECIAILQLIINTEIDAYESNIFIHKQGLTESNYHSYYHDIADNIISKLSPNLVKNLQMYITEEAIYSYVCKAVLKYLKSKVATL